VLAAARPKISADAGDADAHVSDGHRLMRGDGVPPNPVNAAEYFKLSADQGNPFG
jgi:TPR repeat protein